MPHQKLQAAPASPGLQQLLLWPLLLHQLLQLPAAADARLQLRSEPDRLVLTVGSGLLANLTASVANASSGEAFGNFSCAVEDPEVAGVSGGVSWWQWQLPDNLTDEAVTVVAELAGRKFGWTFLACGGVSNSSATAPGAARLQVTVLKDSGPLDLAYRVLLILLVICVVFCMGASVELRAVWRLVKRPVALGIGLACQFLLMPHLGLALGQLSRLALPNFVNPGALAFGFLTHGCSPGGGSSNMWTYLLDGDLDLSMTMTFFSQVCAFFMMPLWLFVYGRLYMDPAEVRIPFDQVALTLLQSVVPIVLGVLVRFKWPKAGQKISKAIGPLTLLFIVVVAGLGSYVNFHLLELLWKNPLVLPLAGALPWLAFLLAFLVATACRLSRPQATAVALECGVQNAGIPIQLLLYSMAKPDGDIASLVPVAATVLTPVPLYFAVAGHRLRRRFCPGGSSAKYELEMTHAAEAAAAEVADGDVEKEAGG